MAKPPTVRDRLWLWGHEAGSHNEGWGLPGPSQIMPAAAAAYLGISNLVMVRYLGRPPLPLDPYAETLRGLRRVVWSAVGAHGQTDDRERVHVLALAARHRNVTGIILDDFFGEPLGKTALSLDQLRELRDQLSVGRRLDLWAVLYEHQVQRHLTPYLELMDVVSLARPATQRPDAEGAAIPLVVGSSLRSYDVKES